MTMSGTGSVNPSRQLLADSLASFVDDSPDPAHGVKTLCRRLEQAGSQRLDPRDPWVIQPGSLYHVPFGTRGLGVFRPGMAPSGAGGAPSGFRIAAAHTDSPCLRLRTGAVNFHDRLMLTQTETYGSLIRSSILDRPLQVSGEVHFERHGLVQSRNLRFGSLRVTIPQLAIHLNRDVNKGFEFNEHQHLRCICLDPVPDHARLDPWAWLCARELVQQEPDLAGLSALNMVQMDLYLGDAAPASLMGDPVQGLFVNSGRLDNLAGCHGVLEAMLDPVAAPATRVALFFDHEEVGSRSAYGADSAWTERFMRRIWLAANPGQGFNEEDYLRSLAASTLLSVDAAQGFHPNFPERFDPASSPRLGLGVAVKINAQQRYASNPATLAWLRSRAAGAGIPLQTYMTRADIPCGSTIGPMMASLTGIPGADIGIPLLAMHAAREFASIDDQAACIALIKLHLEAAP